MPEAHPSPEPALRTDALDYTLSPRSVGLARRRAARLVAEWGHPGLAGDTALLLSELATNALVHGHVPGRLFRVELSLTRSALRIAVSDARGEALPRPRPAPLAGTSGRGLLIVRTLAARWGVTHRTVGKTVWCELDLPAGPAGPAAPAAVRCIGLVPEERGGGSAG